MKKKLVMIVLAAVAAVSLGACGKTPDPADGMALATNDYVDFSFEYPQEWELLRDDAMIAVGDADDNANLSVTSFETKDPNQPVLEYWTEYKEVFAEAFGEMEIVSEDEIQLGGVPALRVHYTNTLLEDTFSCDMVIGIRNGIVYTMTYTAKPDTYDAHIGNLDYAVTTFQFK